MKKTKENIEYIQHQLDYYKCGYDLCGVEITEEDAENVIDLINDNYTEDQAIDEVLNGINDVVSEGWEY